MKRFFKYTGIFILLIIVLAIIGSIVGDEKNAINSDNPKDEPIAIEKATLPPYKYFPSSRIGQARAQIRAIIPIGSLTEQEIRQTSLDLAKANSYVGGSYLVQFFDDKSCLDGWDGTGTLRDADWPHWLCRVTVDTDNNGNLYTGSFKLAVDESTGLERTDVLRK